jgi:hypothetical protein
MRSCAAPFVDLLHDGHRAPSGGLRYLSVRFLEDARSAATLGVRRAP